jgi:CheY-like chemotaxis protein
VLIVEDEAMVALNLEALIEELGHDVIGIAATRPQAMELAARQAPQVAVVDLNLLDGRTGLALAHVLAAAYGTVVVIATGNPEGIAPAGAVVAVLRKPYTDRALSEAVSQAAGAALARPHPAAARLEQANVGA